MGGLYIATNQQNTVQSGFTNMSRLPNVDIPDQNFPDLRPSESEPTSKLSTVNQYDGRRAYTDKFFAPPVESTNTTKYNSITGEQVDENYFRHNNMVPFFGGNIRTRAIDAKSSESILDNYIGAGSQIQSKQERAPLFSPSENQQWANGAPNTTDFMRSRVNPSMRMANVKPFEEERVAPGLGLGFTTAGSGGFNSGLMERDAWREKTVDELRVATNPKSSGNMILDYAGPANSHIKRTAEQGIQEKNRVDTTFEFTSDRYFTTTGIEKGPTMRAFHTERDMARPETTTSYAGVASHGNSTIYVARSPPLVRWERAVQQTRIMVSKRKLRIRIIVPPIFKTSISVPLVVRSVPPSRRYWMPSVRRARRIRSVIFAPIRMRNPQ
ncbi:hypothetical protein EB093_08165 [bacterium]|nr:hypothetical protein [bacterium]